ncbi:MAG: hypothetical protein KDJ39_09025 [Gammaproteobacteria bacterium]|nr:hypothetical protein [Gammaproteobacteria bacterium]MCP5298988.1 hypothetical protein [Chromatiaceae bacterium]
MDPDLIRLILVILGVLLVVGIYLWDRFKRAAPPRRMVRQAPSALSADAIVVDDDARREPHVDSQPESIPSIALDDDERRSPRARSDVADELDPEPLDIGEWHKASGNGDPQFAMDLQFDAHGDSDYLSTDPALRDDVERKIVALNVVASTGDFRGDSIERACTAVDLAPGEMSIYHHHDARTGRVLFSMASMVEPGTFPFDGMKRFSTPGLALFTQLPGARDGVEIYDAMLAAARGLAAALHGEVQDERHNKLTGQMEKHIREAIIEHRHRLKLQRSRR